MGVAKPKFPYDRDHSEQPALQATRPDSTIRTILDLRRAVRECNFRLPNFLRIVHVGQTRYGALFLNVL